MHTTQGKLSYLKQSHDLPSICLQQDLHDLIMFEVLTYEKFAQNNLKAKTKQSDVLMDGTLLQPCICIGKAAYLSGLTWHQHKHIAALVI